MGLEQPTPSEHGHWSSFLHGSRTSTHRLVKGIVCLPLSGSQQLFRAQLAAAHVDRQRFACLALLIGRSRRQTRHPPRRLQAHHSSRGWHPGGFSGSGAACGDRQTPQVTLLPAALRQTSGTGMHETAAATGLSRCPQAMKVG
jgi:hypothetical protein